MQKYMFFLFGYVFYTMYFLRKTSPMKNFFNKMYIFTIEQQMKKNSHAIS